MTTLEIVKLNFAAGKLPFRLMKKWLGTPSPFLNGEKPIRLIMDEPHRSNYETQKQVCDAVREFIPTCEKKVGYNAWY